MKTSGTLRRTFWSFASLSAVLLATRLVQAEDHPHLFRQPPAPTWPGRNATAAFIGDIDSAVLSSGPDGLTISLPGQPDHLFERHSHQVRGGRSSVWRGKMAGDTAAKATLTYHEGLLFGRVETAGEVYSIRSGANGRTIIERIDTDSFRPEWGHDHASHRHERVPPLFDRANTQQSSPDVPTSSAAAGGTVEIVLMSVYTPQARAAAGGTTQIQGQIQAAVDQANTAFINSNMIVRYRLAHTEEVAYNDSGSIDADLDWVTFDSGVASLRNTYGADMVSLIVDNGGAYCGISWIQRNPGSGFAPYAFQAADRNCLANSTLAHEHGHNLGMEHNPENSSAGSTPSEASYPWSFGHWVSGRFATIMTYNSICPSYCPRVLMFSNPDVLYNGLPAGISGQRDNAQTGDSTALIVAAFRGGSGGSANNPPAFTSDPVNKPNATAGQAYSATLSGTASDIDGDALSFAKSGGPAWLSIAANGFLSGTPSASDQGYNSFSISVSDRHGASDTATLVVNVVGSFAAPSNLTAIAMGKKRINLSWADNSTGERGFRIERSTNGQSFSRIATVGPGVTSFSNTGLRAGRIYYYRVCAYTSSTNSGYSNIVSVIAK